MTPLITGCADIEGQQQSICRDLVRALDADVGVAIVEAAAPAPAADTVQVDYRVIVDASWERRRISCRFATGTPLERPQLVQVIDQRGQVLGPAALFFLESSWLGRPAEAGADPTTPPPQTAMMLQQFVNAIGVGSAYALLAIAFSLVHALVGRFHLALGDLAMIGAVGGLNLLVAMAAGLPPWALPAALLVAAGLAILPSSLLAAGTGAGRLGPLWYRPGLTPLIATLGLSLALREAARLAQGGQEPWLPPLLGHPIELLTLEGFAVTVTPRHLLVLGIALALWAGCAWLLARTGLGRSIRAVADDPTMASLLGVDPARITSWTMALAGAAAALAGVTLLVAWGTMSIEGGFLLGLKALAAAILGGIGSVHGAALGGFAIGLIETFWTAWLGGTWRDAASFLILAALLVVRPAGLLSRPVPLANDRFRPGA